MSKLLYTVINPIVNGLLRSPLHALMNNNTMLLEFKGRKSGRMFTAPVSYHVEGGRVQCFTSREFGWWRNLVDAKEVVLTLKGDCIVGAPSV